MKESRGVENSCVGAYRLRLVNRPPTIRPSPPQIAVARVPDGLLHKAPHHDPIPDSRSAGATTFRAPPVPAQNSPTPATAPAGPPPNLVPNTFIPPPLLSPSS